MRSGARLYYGWVVVTVAFVTMAISINLRTSFSLFFVSLLEEFRWGRGVTALGFSLNMLMYTLTSPAIGWLLDRYGPRVVVPVAVSLLSAGMAGSGFISELWHFYLFQGVVVGASTGGLGYTAHSVFLPNWFVRQRGLAIGLAFSGVGVGALVLLPAIQWLITTAGWRWSYLLLGLLALVVVAPLNSIFQRREPQDLGLLPDGHTAAAHPGQKRREILTVVDPTWAVTDWTARRALGTGRFWLVSGAFFLTLFAFYLVQVHQVAHVVDQGYSRVFAASILGASGILASIAGIVWGAVSDRIGREPVWTLGCTGYFVALLLLLLLGPDRAWMLYALVVCQGFLGGAMAPLYASIPAEIFGGTHFGAVLGCLSVGAGLGSALGPWVGGLLYDATGSYRAAFLLALGAVATSAFFIWVAAPRKVRRVGRAI